MNLLTKFILISLFIISPFLKTQASPPAPISFKKYIEKTIRYLENFQMHLVNCSKEAAHKDLIKIEVIEDLKSRYTTNIDLMYQMRYDIISKLEQHLTKAFDGKREMSYLFFCKKMAIAFSDLIATIKQLNPKDLKKTYRKDLRKYKIARYPSIQKIMLVILLNSNKLHRRK